MLDKYFHLRQRNTDLKTEIVAGITTFLTMAYIIVVNPSILAEAGMDKPALIAVTCIVAAISSILMGLIPNVPIAMAPGMGLNAFFTYTLVITEGIRWQTALGMTFVAGVLFLLLSIGGFREKLVKGIPQSMITAISAGIGLFLLFIGLKNMGLVTSHPVTFVTRGAFGPTTLVAVAGFFLSVILIIRKVRGAILAGIVAATVAAFVLGLESLPASLAPRAIDLSPVAFQLDIAGALRLSLLAPLFALLYVDMFDTLGTVIACANQAGLVKKKGTVERLSHMLGVDAVATMISGLLGTSPTTSYIESATGIAAGGRTGLTAVVTGLLFLLGLLLIPLVEVVPVYATAPALVIVGIFMLKEVVNIDFARYEESIPAILTLIVMPLTFSISMGMAFGFISWVFIRVLLFKFKEIPWIMYVIMALSLMSLLV